MLIKDRLNPRNYIVFKGAVPQVRGAVPREFLSHLAVCYFEIFYILFYSKNLSSDTVSILRDSYEQNFMSYP